jgi:hypothetical protein
MSRFFAYGCSFTKYYYPTWADIIINDVDEGYNCGKLGSGNQLISQRIHETNAKKKFNSDDTIIIMWSNFFREDEYKDNKWHCHGNVFHSKNTFQDLEYYVYRDCATITSTLQALRASGATVVSTSINNPYHDGLLMSDLAIKPVLELYQEWVTPETKTMTEQFWYPGIETDKTRPQYKKDGVWLIEDHPLPFEHCSFVEDVLQYKVSDKTKALVEESHRKISELEFSEYDRIFESAKSIEWIV